jgi:hypothetical protein
MLLSKVIDFVKENKAKNRREAFGFEGDTLKMYVTWAFSFNYLFVVFNNNEITGVGVAYPLKTPYNGDKFTLFIFNDIVPEAEEYKHELCIMDLITLNEEATKTMVNDFKKRYPNWENQTKWMIRSDEAKEFKNKHLTLLNKI